MNEIVTKEIERLSNICARLASTFDGERAAAALLASQTLEAMGLRWQEIIIRAFQAPAVKKTARPAFEEDELDARTAARLHNYGILLRWPGLNDWERCFISDMRDREPFEWSEKQRACVLKIIRRCQAQRREKPR